MIRNEDGLLALLAKYLKESSEPLTSIELFERSDVKKLAKTANRVSDYLGNLWRKGLAERLPAPRTNNSTARWMYQWKKQKPTSKKDVRSEPIPFDPTQSRSLLKKANIEITEDGDIIHIDLPHLTIMIRPKR